MALYQVDARDISPILDPRLEVGDLLRERGTHGCYFPMTRRAMPIETRSFPVARLRERNQESVARYRIIPPSVLPNSAGNPLLGTAGELLYDAFPARVTGKLVA
jgi:hypothetical protein